MTEPTKPQYYQAGSGDAIEYSLRHGLNGPSLAILKYITRAGKKTPDALTDLEKAREYLDRWIEFEKERQG